MTLRTKLVFGIVATLSALVAALYLISSVSLERRFAKLETKDARDNVQRAVNAFNNEVDGMVLKVTDWSVWDDTYRFIEDNNEGYRKSNLLEETFRNMQLNLMVFVRVSGEVRHVGAFDLAANQSRPVPEAFLKLLTADSPLLSHVASEKHTGMVLLPEGPMMIVAAPILNSEGKGPVRGTLIFGRWLSEEGVRRLAEHTRLSLAVQRLDAPQLPPDLESVRVVLSGLPPPHPILVRPTNDKTIAGYTIMNDIYERPALLFHVDIPRDIFAEGRASIRQLLLTLVVVSLGFGLVAHWLLGKLFLSRLAQRESEERYRAVIAQAAEGILLAEPATARVLEANAAMQELLGYTAPELLQLHTPDFFPPDLKSGQDRIASEQHCRRKDGSTVEVELITNRISYGDRTVGCFVVRNITARKQAEAELEQTHKELLETSRQAGMAEVATGVLHNVGNVLNSVNVASSCVADSIRKSKAANLAKVVVLLREHEANLGAFLTDDPKGKQIPGYLAQLAEHLAGEQDTVLKELAQLQKNIEHIKDIVTMQQSFAQVSGATETLSVADLMDDALKMNASALARHNIAVTREFEEVPRLTVEKHKVLQILVNLVRNAKQACRESDRADKQLTVRVANGDGGVKMSVMDNGIGIAAENLARVFSHGFTTKKDGHGFGLHSGVLTAREMGGSLTVHSDGVGKGAAFTLTLPCPAKEGNS